jgi:hypothetical protein
MAIGPNGDFKRRVTGSAEGVLLTRNQKVKLARFNCGGATKSLQQAR